MVVQLNYRNFIGFSKDSLFTFQCTLTYYLKINLKFIFYNKKYFNFALLY